MRALLAVSGVGDKEVRISLPAPYCSADGSTGYIGMADDLEKKGCDELLSFPDGVGFLHTIKHSDGGFGVDIISSAEK